MSTVTNNSFFIAVDELLVTKWLSFPASFPTSHRAILDLFSASESTMK